MAHEPNDSRVHSATEPVNKTDGLGIVLLIIFLLSLSYLGSRHKMFWSDEIMGLLVLKQKTWPELLHFWKSGLDSSGIWFEVLGHFWIRLFGSSEVSLRMFSAAGITASAVVLWISARRYYSTLPVAAAILTFYSYTQALRWQLANGRTYGVFMLACTLVIYLLVRGEDRAARPSQAPFLLATFACYGLLAGSHILGSVYAGMFLAIQVVLDILARRRRPLLYVSALCGIVPVVLFSLPNLRATLALGKPKFWTPKPAIRDLLLGRIVLADRQFQLCIAVLLLTALFFRLRRQRLPIYIVLLGFAGLDLLFFTISRVTTSIYVDRYMLPLCLAAVFLLCELLTQLREASAPHPGLRFAAPWAVIALTLLFLKYPGQDAQWLPIPDYTSGFLAALPPRLPVIEPEVDNFVEVEFYHPGSIGRPWYFPVDWKVALDPSNPIGVSGNHEMDNFKMVGLDRSQIMPDEELLARNPEFVVVCSGTNVWFRRRILPDPQLVATKLKTFEYSGQSRDIWLVKRAAANG